MDDEGGEARERDVVEHRGQGIQSQHQDEAVEDAGQGGAYARLGQDGGAAKGARGRVGAHKAARQVREGDGDELLRRHHRVVVDAPKRLADGDVLD